MGLMAVLLAATALAAAGEPVTFNKDVLPILQKNCQTCHRPGNIAPMSFLSYESTRPWAKAMKTAVVTRKMPAPDRFEMTYTAGTHRGLVVVTVRPKSVDIAAHES